jgi:hypothetical protein
MTEFSKEEKAALRADERRRDMVMEGQMLFQNIRVKRSGNAPFSSCRMFNKVFEVSKRTFMCLGL